LIAALPVHATPKGIIGGPPCQAFSVGNVYKNPNDPRSKLPINYANIVGALSNSAGLDFFVFENVVGLRSARHAEQLALFRELFASHGFQLFEEELNALDFGVPQRRSRVFIVGVNKDRFPGLEFKFPQGSSRHLTVRSAIFGLPDPVLFRRGLDPIEVKSIAGHPNHWAMKPRSSKFINANGELVPGDRRGRAFRVLNWDEPSLTVAYGHREVHVHPNLKRRLSVYEAMLLQGFPKKRYQLYGNLSDQIRLVSDAVPPPMARAIAEAIKDQLY